MADLAGLLAIFCFGAAFGGTLIVYQASRPNGYGTPSGRRYRLVEIVPKSVADVFE